MIKQCANVKGAKVNLLGLTFKEDCQDLRNSKVIDVIRELEAFGCDVRGCDSLADPAEAMREYGVTLLPMEELPKGVSVVILAVAHEVFRNMPMEQLLFTLKQPNSLLVDVRPACRHPLCKIRSGVCDMIKNGIST
jgi:UDP-N-acetyl-D-galactosamine dehydrogenase